MMEKHLQGNEIYVMVKKEKGKVERKINEIRDLQAKRDRGMALDSTHGVLLLRMFCG